MAYLMNARVARTETDNYQWRGREADPKYEAAFIECEWNAIVYAIEDAVNSGSYETTLADTYAIIHISEQFYKAIHFKSDHVLAAVNLAKLQDLNYAVNGCSISWTHDF
jgi:hypothetical protein